MTATVAMVVSTLPGATMHHVRLATFDMTSVEQARDEFGPTLADAKAFVLGVCCNGCGYEASSTEACTECGAPTCACIRDPHDPDLWFCADCDVPACMCRACDDEPVRW